MFIFFGKAAVKCGDGEVLVGALGLVDELTSVAQRWEAATCDAIDRFQAVFFSSLI